VVERWDWGSRYLAPSRGGGLEKRAGGPRNTAKGTTKRRGRGAPISLRKNRIRAREAVRVSRAVCKGGGSLAGWVETCRRGKAAGPKRERD